MNLPENVDKNVIQYLQRIAYSGPTNKCTATLRALHLAHMMSVPFENLDIPLGKKIELNPEALLNKVIHQRRGGFCYELNYTFSWLLTQLGFKVSFLGAQVFGKDNNGIQKYGPPLDHMLLLVEEEQSQWIADVGFGDSFVEPLDLSGQNQRQISYKIRQTDGFFELLRQKPGEAFTPQYKFDLTLFELDDFKPMCHFQQTSLESGFSHKSVCSIATLQGRKTISNGRFIDSSCSQESELATKRPIENVTQYRQILSQHFNIKLDQNAPLEKLCFDQYKT